MSVNFKLSRAALVRLERMVMCDKEYEYSDENPWEPTFNRMPHEEKMLILHIADQLGKRQYFNAIHSIGDLLKLCVKNQKELSRPVDA